MRLRTPLLTFAAITLASCAVALAQEQERTDQQIIDDFVVTRGVSLDPPGKQKQKARPAPARSSSAKNRKPVAGSPSGDATASKSTTGKGGAASKADVGAAAPVANAQAGNAQAGGANFVPAAARTLSLGYTIFLKDPDGRLTYADPSQDFRTGDHIAIAFESNADGYLYLFNSSGAAKTPDMVFPSAAIDDGANALRGSVYETFPSEMDTGFVFTEPAGAERIFFVFSRTPLAGVPTGAALVKFCQGKGVDCVWPVSAAQWSRILGGTKGRTINTQLAQEGPPPPDTLAMVQRGIRVSKTAPKPAFLRVGDTPDADILVTEIVLTHK